MAEKNIRVFKGLNSVTDPSFLDEAGGQLVWAENVDFRSGKIRPLPKSELVLTQPDDYQVGLNPVPQFYQGNYLTQEARSNVWGLNDIYSVSLWVLGQDVFYYLLSHTTQDFYIYRGTLDYLNPIPDLSVDFRKKVGVPAPDEIEPSLSSSFNTKIKTVYDSANYAISFTQNHFGRITEGPLTFLKSFSGFSNYGFEYISDYSSGISDLHNEDQENYSLNTIQSSKLLYSGVLAPYINSSVAGSKLTLIRSYHSDAGYYYGFGSEVSWSKSGSVLLRFSPDFGDDASIRFTDQILATVRANPESTSGGAMIVVHSRPKLSAELFTRNIASSVMWVTTSQVDTSTQCLLRNGNTGDIDFQAEFNDGDYFLLGGMLSDYGNPVADYFIGRVAGEPSGPDYMEFEILLNPSLVPAPQALTQFSSSSPRGALNFFSIMKFTSLYPDLMVRVFDNSRNEITSLQFDVEISGQSIMQKYLDNPVDKHIYLGVSWDFAPSTGDGKVTVLGDISNDATPESNLNWGSVPVTKSSASANNVSLGAAKLTLLGSCNTDFSSYSEQDLTLGHTRATGFRPYGIHNISSSIGAYVTRQGNHVSPNRYDNIIYNFTSRGRGGMTMDLQQVVVADDYHADLGSNSASSPHFREISFGQNYDVLVPCPTEPTTVGDHFFPGQSTVVAGYTTAWNLYRLYNGEYLKVASLPTYGFVPSSLMATGSIDLLADTSKTGSTKQAVPNVTNYSSNVTFSAGDFVISGSSYYRYLGNRSYSFTAGLSSAADQIITFSNDPDAELNSQNYIESVLIGNELQREYWELLDYDPRVQFVDIVADEELGDQSESFFTSSVTGDDILLQSPIEGLDGIIDQPYANMMFGWKGSVLYWSETLLGHSWSKSSFFYNFPDQIVGVIGGSEQLTVVTKTSVHSTTNRNPEEITFYDVANIGALNRFAVSSWEGNVVFLSHLGLILFRGGNYTNLTQQAIPSEVFRSSVAPITDRELGTDRVENPCVGVFNDTIFFYLPNAGMYAYNVREQVTTEIKLPDGPDGIPLSVRLIQTHYDDKAVAVSQVNSKIIYTVLLDPFVAPPGLEYSEFFAHSADIDLNRTDWKQFESLQFQGSGIVEVCILDRDSIILKRDDQDPRTNIDGEGYVYPVGTNSFFVSGDTVGGAQVIPQPADRTAFYSERDLIILFNSSGIANGRKAYEVFEVQDIDASNLTLDRPIFPVNDNGLLSPSSVGTVSQVMFGTGLQGERIYNPRFSEYRSGAAFLSDVYIQPRRNWDFKAGAVIVVKDATSVIGRRYLKYKGDKILNFNTEGVDSFQFSDTPSATEIESVILSTTQFNSDYWEDVSYQSRQKVFDITDQYGSTLGAGLIGDTVTIPPLQKIFKGDILHGKLRNGRQFWAQYLGEHTISNLSSSHLTLPMVKSIDISTSVGVPAVCIYEDQIYQPYINVFPYQGYQIDFTNLDGSRVGVPFDCPVDRLSFIIRGTGKVIGVTINGF